MRRSAAARAEYADAADHRPPDVQRGRLDRVATGVLDPRVDGARPGVADSPAAGRSGRGRSRRVPGPERRARRSTAGSTAAAVPRTRCMRAMMNRMRGPVPTEVLADEQQRVAQHQVVDDVRAATEVGVRDAGAAHDPDLPPGPPRPLAQVGLFAVGEVPLVEQADLLQTGPPGEHQRPVRISGRLPALAAPGPGTVMPPKYVVDHRRLAVTDVGAGQPGARSIVDAPPSIRARQSGAGSASCGATTHHSPASRAEPVSPPGVGARTEAGVLAELQHGDVVDRPQHRQLLSRGPVVDDHDVDVDALLGRGTPRPPRHTAWPGSSARAPRSPHSIWVI